MSARGWGYDVSIHSLRKKGDTAWMVLGWPAHGFNPLPSQEGRPAGLMITFGLRRFNPLPSQEGRPKAAVIQTATCTFQSTPFARRETITA